ncbi:MAG: ABC transporter permease [Nitrospirae bacterium]|nr:ABC transporter permease [Nitrospirota bacterium]
MATSQNNIHEQEIIIRPPSKLAHLNVRELYKYRHMLWSMVWRNIRAQFDDMYLGGFWAVARPLTMVSVFALLKRFSSANMYVSIPYSVYVYSGLIFWFYFLEATTATAASVTQDANLIKKIYFPRLVTPMVPVLSNLYSLGIASIPLIFMMMWHGIYPGLSLFFLPAVLFQCMTLSMGIGMIFASLSLTNRDSERFLGLILYLGIFISPVIFAPDMIPARGRFFYFLNPMAGTLLAFRSCMFSDFPFPVSQWAYSAVFSCVILVIGTIMYRHAEIYFADKL